MNCSLPGRRPCIIGRVLAAGLVDAAAEVLVVMVPQVVITIGATTAVPPRADQR